MCILMVFLLLCFLKFRLQRDRMHLEFVVKFGKKLTCHEIFVSTFPRFFWKGIRSCPGLNADVNVIEVFNATFLKQQISLVIFDKYIQCNKSSLLGRRQALQNEYRKMLHDSECFSKCFRKTSSNASSNGAILLRRMSWKLDDWRRGLADHSKLAQVHGFKFFLQGVW